jgi:hypothetical protein
MSAVKVSTPFIPSNERTAMRDRVSSAAPGLVKKKTTTLFCSTAVAALRTCGGTVSTGFFGLLGAGLGSALGASALRASGRAGLSADVWALGAAGFAGVAGGVTDSVWLLRVARKTAQSAARPSRAIRTGRGTAIARSIGSPTTVV